MSAAPSSSPSPEESALLEQIDKVEAAVRAKPTARVIKRVLDLAVRLRGLAAFDQIRQSVEQSTEPELTLDEINAEISAARAERGTRSQTGR